MEQHFTRDREQVFETLRRMQHDITLWGGNFAHLTEEPFFTGLTALVELLGMYPGNKALVMFSVHPGSSAEDDLRFARLAGAAAASRCSIYTMDAGGLASSPYG